MEEQNKDVAQELVDKIQEDQHKLKEICIIQNDLIDSLKRRNNRLEKELEYKNEDIFKKLIPILDDMVLVEENESVSEGVRIIFNKLIGILKDEELLEFDSDEYKKFNADLHNAIDIKYYDKNMVIPTGSIDSIRRKGYRYKDKVIRHADVVVAKNKK